MTVKQYLFLLPLALFLIVPSHGIQAQDLGGVDISNIRADQLSESQIRQLDQRIRDEGISLAEFERLAIQRGGSPSEVRAVRQRVQEYRADRDERETLETGQTRTVEREREPQFVPIDVERPTPDSLKVFGMDLFGQVSRTFEPSFNIPTPTDYTLGPGDELVIDVWGAAETNYRLTINAEGNVRIDNIGPIHLNGLTIEEAESRILNRLSNIFSGLRPNNPQEANTFANVSLGNVRSIKVTVMGEVRQPATYTVTSLSTVFNALYAAGGPTRSGSFRSIQVIRGQDVVATLDVYDFLIYGDQTDNIRLRDQDIIKVNPTINRVHVWGETKRKGFFELKDGETLAHLIDYTGGFTEEAYTKRLVLHRNTPTQRSVSDVLYPEGEDLEIRNGDKLRVGQILERYENRVSIDGAVYRPGDYELTPDMTLYELIQKADGPTQDAFMSRGIIYRLKDDLSLETQSFDIRNLIMNRDEHDITLRRDDQVRITSIFDMREDYTINVSGAVNEGGEFNFAENMTIEDAIFRAGGFRESAAAYRVEIARRVTGENQEYRMDRIADIFRFSVDQDLQFSTDDRDFRLKPFDQVFVRPRPNYQPQQTVRIEGEVQFPGTYVLESRNARLSDLIEWAGGLSDYAFPEGASLERQIVDDRLEEVQLLDTLIIETLDGTTQVGIRLSDVIGNESSPANLILEPGDVIKVPKELQTVRIEGEVLHSVSVRFDSRRSFQSYIDAAGGVTDEAQRRRAYIVYANGEVDRTKRFLVFRSNPEVRPGATIYIPPKPERRELTVQERVSLASSIASTAILIATLVDRLSR
jgi:protein involved in polysaccharide export with SLBB domain